MSVGKTIDYDGMFKALDALVSKALPQMELDCEIGRVVSIRPEKGAAVAAAEYLCCAYPNSSGFSPRNLRRMRKFYHTYAKTPDILVEAVTIGWTQNVVIFEAELANTERTWYIRAARRFGWSKLELQRKIKERTHLEEALDLAPEVCYTEDNHTETERKSDDKNTFYLSWKG